MAKLSDSPITAEDLLEFAEADSDFGFEMKVLRQLRADGFACSHSGTYQDPVTSKIRQFDIRASRERPGSVLTLAVECKNLRSNNPLLLSAVPRTQPEAFHDLVLLRPERIGPTVGAIIGNTSAYKPGEMVAKKTDQVCRLAATNELNSNDEATFEKLNQAVSSCQDLVRGSANRPLASIKKAIVPVLVVPTGLLWQVDYNVDGAMSVSPRQISRAALFRDHTWLVPGAYGETHPYRLSHIEVVTLGAVAEAIESWLGPEGFFPP